MDFSLRLRHALIAGCCLLFIGCLGAAPEQWVTVSYPEFKVVSSLPPAEARTWAFEFAQYVASLKGYFGADIITGLPPLTIVVFKREGAFRKYRPLDNRGKPEEVGGFFQNRESWAIAGLPASAETDEVRRIIFHEGVHWFLSDVKTPTAPWLEEGLAEVFSTFRIEGDKAEWGHAIEGHVGTLNTRSLMSLEKLLFVPRSDWHNGDEMRRELLYAESWGFVHYMLFGKNGLPPDTLKKYGDLLASGIHPDDAFQQAFGKTYKEMDLQLKRYVSGGQYYVRSRPIGAATLSQPQIASLVEVSDALGRLALAAGLWDLAVTHAKAAIAAGPADPRGYEVLGLALKGKQDEVGAMAALDLAIQYRSKDYQPYFERALSFQGRSGGALSVERYNISAENARKAALLYEHAINLSPRQAWSYRNLAGLVGVLEPWDGNETKYLRLGAQLYPKDAGIQVGLAICALRSGNKEEGRELLAKVLATTEPENAEHRRMAAEVMNNLTNEEGFNKINALIEAGELNEALAAIDAWQQRGASTDVQVPLRNQRRFVVSNLKLKEIQAAMEERRWVDARHLIKDFQESDAPVAMKRNVNRFLERLDQMNVGLEAK